MRVLTCLITLMAFFSSACFAQVIAPLDANPISGQEFFVGKELGKPLITISLLNGVTRPGVYHVPAQTSLPQLLAYAGGSLISSDTSEIRIRRVDRDKSLFIREDLNATINENLPFPQMSDKDVVQIREKNLDYAVRWVVIVSGIATTLLSIALFEQANKNL